MSRLPITVLLLFAGLCANGQESYTIKGSVLSEGKTPLAGATVFLANTTKGTTTNDEGKFELNALAAGGYKLVVSFIGFQVRTINIRVPENKMFSIALSPVVQQLNEVVITGRRLRKTEWLENVKTFKENFIGLSENSKHCFILNEDALSFRKNLNTLEASADSLLVIQNQGLGYSLNFLLEKFRYDQATRKVIYKGHTVYTPLVPRNDEEKLRWAANRLKAYYGSEMHFIRALYKRQLIEEGFFSNLFQDYLVNNHRVNKAIADTVLLVKSKLFKRKIRMPTIWEYNRILDSLSTDTHPAMAFKGQLEVIYIHEGENFRYTGSREPRRVGQTIAQRSRVILLGPSVAFERDGQILNDEGLFMTQGYWSWEMVSESLPYDYNPADDLEIIRPN